MKNALLVWILILGVALGDNVTNNFTGQQTATGDQRSNVASASSGGDITTALVAWWKADEGSGMSAIDSSGNGHTGTANGSPSWTTGMIGPFAFSYGGLAGFTFSPITMGTTFTYSAWVYPNTTGGYQNLLTEGNTLGLWFHGGSVDFYFSGDHVANTALSLNNWHHVVVINNSGAVSFYIDGALDANTYTSAPSFNANGMGIDSTVSEGFNGNQDDIRIYSRALSAADVALLYSYR